MVVNEMILPFIIFVFLLPLTTAIFNIINSRKNGKQGIVAFIVTLLLWFITFISTAISTTYALKLRLLSYVKKDYHAMRRLLFPMLLYIQKPFVNQFRSRTAREPAPYRYQNKRW